MPPNPEMKDQQIADVLTYIRNSFGNKAASVKASDVKAVRSKLK
jgi:mono/diheme cytochrome c family protein